MTTQTISLSAAISVIEARDNYVANHEDGIMVAFMDDAKYTRLEAAAEGARLYINSRIQGENPFALFGASEVEIARALLEGGAPDSL